MVKTRQIRWHQRQVREEEVEAARKLPARVVTRTWNRRSSERSPQNWRNAAASGASADGPTSTALPTASRSTCSNRSPTV